MKKRAIEEQTMVITGASSGIGLATAYLAAEKGARVVLASRNGEDLRKICENIEKRGGAATWIEADVTRREDMEKLSNHAIETFQGYDTWVNNAGIGIFGKVLDVPIEDERQLFETNFWGVIYGSLIALEQMRELGGTIINLGSVVSDRTLPLLGTYSASKHAVKAFGDALRMEIEKENLPVSLTTIRPGVINTPFTRHARNWMDEKATLPPPWYDPDVVARAIVQCAQYPKRNVTVANMAATPMAQMEHLMPGTLDRLMEGTLFEMQKRRGEPKRGEDALHEPVDKEGEIRGDYEGPVLKRNLSASVRLDPKKKAAATALGLSALAWVGYSAFSD